MEALDQWLGTICVLVGHQLALRIAPEFDAEAIGRGDADQVCGSVVGIRGGLVQRIGVGHEAAQAVVPAAAARAFFAGGLDFLSPAVVAVAGDAA
ncbi:hypothetical protein D3C71_1412860 [compost metagenome]